MTKQIKLKVEQENEVVVVGILSQENDLKVTWSINKNLGLKLSRTDNIRNNKNIPEDGFPLYIFNDEPNQIKYALIINRVKGTNLFNSIKNIDYLLVLKGNVPTSEKKDLITKIKQLPEITTTIEVDTDKIKEKDIFSMF